MENFTSSPLAAAWAWAEPPAPLSWISAGPRSGLGHCSLHTAEASPGHTLASVRCVGCVTCGVCVVCGVWCDMKVLVATASLPVGR